MLAWSIEAVAAAVLNREAIMGTGLGQGLAVPHAQLPSIKGAVVVAAIARQGLQFEGLDSEPVQLIFLILTPESAPETQIEILAAIARIAGKPALLHHVAQARTPTDLLAALRIADMEAA